MKIPVATIYLKFPLSGNEQKGWTVKREALSSFITEFEEAMESPPNPDEYIIKFHELEESELANLPEWEGW